MKVYELINSLKDARVLADVKILDETDKNAICFEIVNITGGENELYINIREVKEAE